MKILKKLSLILCSVVVFVCASLVLFGCEKDKDYNQLYVFCSKGGYVTVEGQDGQVRNGDEASRIFKIPDQQTVKLSAVAEDGYVFSEWTYAEGLEAKYETFSRQAEINLVSDEPIIVVRAVFVEGNTFSVIYSSGTGYEIKLQNANQTNVAKGGSVRFSVELSAEYNKSEYVVKNNGTILTAVDGVYTISNVQDNVNITVENVVKNKYKVTIPTGDGYVIRTATGYDNNNVLHGNSFKFYLDVASEYNTDDFEVSVNSRVLTASDGLYTISNIVNDCEIVVTNTSASSYTVSVLETTGITINSTSGSFEVNSGDNFQFTITVVDGIDVSEMVVKYYVGSDLIGKVITPVENVYTINNVKSNIKIQIDNISYIKNLISVIDSRFLIEPVNTEKCLVEYGSDFVFKIKLKEGYTQIGDIVVKANGVVLAESNGQYTIQNVTKNQTITVEGIGIFVNKYTVNLSNGEGYEITKTDGSSFDANDLTDISHGTEFAFKVKVLEGYMGSCVVEAVKLFAGTTTLTATDGVYKFVVGANTTITVSGLQLQQFNVILPDVSGVKFKNIDSEEISGNLTVDYGTDFKFKIEITDGLIESFEVKVNDSLISAVEGVYTISSVTSNKQITVSVNREISYKVSITQPLRGANFMLNSSTGQLGEEFRFTVRVDKRYTFENISISSNVGTITKIDEGDFDENHKKVNFVLIYNASAGYEKNIALKIENVFFKYVFRLDYRELDEAVQGQVNDFPLAMYYEMDVNETLKTTYVLDELKMYTIVDGQRLNLAQTKAYIENKALESGVSEFNLGNDFMLGADKFISVNIDEIVEVNWNLVKNIDTEYSIKLI